MWSARYSGKILTKLFEVFRQSFDKSSSVKSSWKFIQLEPIYSMRTDGQTEKRMG
jgi:hypothetical protein